MALLPGLPGMKVYAAWTVDPLVRPTAGQWTRIDQHAPIRRFRSRRGVRIRDGRNERGEGSGVFDNRLGQFTPGSGGAPWSSSVKARRRLRFDISNTGETDRTLFTGFIDSLPPRWRKGDATVTLTASDLLSLISDKRLPDAVLDAVVADLGATHYWPLAEDSGYLADDQIGTTDGFYRYPVASVQAETYDKRGTAEMRLASLALNQPAQTMRAPIGPVDHAMTMAWSWKLNPETTILGALVILLQQSSEPVDIITTPTIVCRLDGTSGITVAALLGGVAAGAASGPYPLLFDGNNHRLAFSLTSAGVLKAYIDGIKVIDVTVTGVAIATVMDAITTLHVGMSPYSTDSVTGARAAVGRVAYFPRALTDAEIAEDNDASANPWDGDTTGERLGRILDLAGVDSGDRNIATGTQICGPTILDRQTVGQYIDKLGDTEGIPVFVDPDGKITLLDRTANSPTSQATFVDSPHLDAGVIYGDVEPADSIDRMVNVVDVTRESGGTQTVINASSVDDYGPISRSIDTLHRTASGARSTAARLVSRNGEPRTVFDSIDIPSRAAPVAATCDIDIGEAITITSRPPPGTKVTELAIVERVEQLVDQKGIWRTKYGAAAHIVLPCLAWDTPGAGWDESVWCDATP